MANSSELLKFLETKKHIIWDWNGTILNDVDLSIRTINKLLTTHNLDLI
jgi:phosphoglycolate phosphatase